MEGDVRPGGGAVEGGGQATSGTGDAGRSPAFVFQLKHAWQRVSQEQLLAALRRLGGLLGGRAFTMKEWDRWADKPCRAITVARHMGTWAQGLAAAGFVGAKRSRIPPEELVAHLEHVWRARGRAPGVRSLARLKGLGGATISVGPYERHWGSLRRACEQMVRYHIGQISRAELLAGRPQGEQGGRRKRHGIPPSVRWEVLERDRHRCTSCGRSAAEGAILEIDHIHPHSAGGSDDPGNLRTMCRDCNRGKGSSLPCP